MGRSMNDISLLFHCVLPENSPEPQTHSELFIPTSQYWKLFSELKQSGYTFALPQDARLIEGPVCSVTFDDGYANNRHFLPIAEHFKIPFVIFVNSLNIETGNPFLWDLWSHYKREQWPFLGLDYQKSYESLFDKASRQSFANENYRPFRTEELLELTKSPLVYLAPHTHSHQPVIEMSPEQIDREIDTNLGFLSQFKNVLTRDFALPCGFYDFSSKKHLLKRFDRIYTVDGARSSLDPQTIHRISLIREESAGPLLDQIKRGSRFTSFCKRKLVNLKYSIKASALFRA